MGRDGLGGSHGCSGVCILLERLDQEDCQTPECPHSGGRAGAVTQELDILLPKELDILDIQKNLIYLIYKRT